jgi:VIT1/CCC1 family predicted Fe2+/Mn2+ transporter
VITGRSALFTAGRMLLVGAIAAGATFSIGRLFGIATS